MTQKELKQIIHIKSEMRMLTIRMKNAGSTAGDYGLDFSTGKKRAFIIQGKHAPEYYDTAAKLSARADELAALVSAAEKFIADIPDPQVRVILTLRYLEGKSWHDVAKAIYKDMTADAVRMTVSNWFKKNKR
ncbi:MAG: hypothetical protein FWB96_11890 [Defluviitaleaceae bacterium]|nr:hypothetical protein [Defluviitaleaceae bacterium]MCL2263789.1 hypothetical protein [Defluviitaleaceae bacterium]